MNTCRFFPSGKVVLSGGADLRLKIWSTEDGSCPVTLKGHTGGLDSIVFQQISTFSLSYESLFEFLIDGSETNVALE